VSAGRALLRKSPDGCVIEMLYCINKAYLGIDMLPIKRNGCTFRPYGQHGPTPRPLYAGAPAFLALAEVTGKNCVHYGESCAEASTQVE